MGWVGFVNLCIRIVECGFCKLRERRDDRGLPCGVTMVGEDYIINSVREGGRGRKLHSGRNGGATVEKRRGHGGTNGGNHCEGCKSSGVQ